MSGVIALLKKIWELIIACFRPPLDPYDEALKRYGAYQTNKQLEDLSAAIEFYESALQLRRRSRDQSDLASLLVNYAVALWSLYNDEPSPTESTRTGYLNNIIRFDEEARHLWNANPPTNDYPILLTNLANAYLELSLLDPAKAITSLTNSLVLNREVFDNPSYPEDIRYTTAFKIGEVLWARYELKTKTPETQFPDEVDGAGRVIEYVPIDKIDEALRKFEDSLEYAETPRNPQIRVDCCYFMTKAYDARYKLSKNTGDLDTAIAYNRRARGYLDQNDVRLEACLRDFCLQLLRKYDIDHDRTHLEKARGIAEGKNKFADILQLVHDQEHQATM